MTYQVEDFSLGEKTKGDFIIFKTMIDLEKAYKDIDNGNDIYIEKDGVVTKILHQTISGKVYDGTIRLGAKKEAD